MIYSHGQGQAKEGNCPPKSFKEGKDKKTLICDPAPANEALCGKINFELWAEL